MRIEWREYRLLHGIPLRKEWKDLQAYTNEKLANLEPQIQEMLTRSFRPEFINRIDEVITFSRLSKESIAEIVRKQLERASRRLIPF